jgi:hypothetical protein
VSTTWAPHTWCLSCRELMRSHLEGLQEQKMLHGRGMTGFATSIGKCGSAGVIQEQAWEAGRKLGIAT